MATPASDSAPAIASVHKPVESLKLLGEWLLANMGTWLLCGAVYLLLMGNIDTDLLTAMPPLLLFACPAVGTAQWLIVRKRLPIGVGWITATLVGGILSLAICFPAIMRMFLPAVMGLTIGIAQWIVFRLNCTPKVRWFFWVIATTIGGTIGYLASFSLRIWITTLLGMTMFSSNSALDLILLGTVIQLISGVITGSTFILLLRQHDRYCLNSEQEVKSNNPNEG